MNHHQVINVSDEVGVDPNGVRIILDTAEGPLSLSIPLETAEALLLNLRSAADDAHRQRIVQGNALRKAIISTDRPPLDTTGCMASATEDGRILLQFRHAAAATTSIFVPPVGAAMLAKALGDLSRTVKPQGAGGAPQQMTDQRAKRGA
ncbi:hypothetical protein [Belnapia rosea]|uniref:Uncharacterized protein n=1 Tax=Belnapia rosea TaxID=938405 RepID=A0A1G6KYI1_9PROT|nr:hypothetical protein [Belnapia rosea]SDB70708.1 hypothetical protein SAMN02927895_03853 [Belnapia rosea]SDC35851.1 hypothetical protein SAMN04487779_1001686 [Belnapia rosea]